LGNGSHTVAVMAFDLQLPYQYRSAPPRAPLFALLAIAWAATVWSAYDPARRTLGLGFGAPLVIGEVAGQHEHGSGTEREDQAREE
jgi:hypothetical protein